MIVAHSMRTLLHAAIVAVACACIGSAVVAQRVEPAESLARVRLVVTTRATSASVSVKGATVASYIAAVASGPPSAAVSRTGAVLQVSRNVAGQIAEAQFAVILADVVPDTLVVWSLTSDS